MTRAKARLFLSWREERLIFTSAGARREQSEPSAFLADIPKDIVRSIDKRTSSAQGVASRGSGGGYRSQQNVGANPTSGEGLRGAKKGYLGAAGGGHGSTRPFGTSPSTSARKSYGNDHGNRKQEAGRNDALDFTTELFKDADPRRSVSSRSRSTTRTTPVNSSQDARWESHGHSGGYRGRADGGDGDDGGKNDVGRASGLSHREIQAFRDQRAKVSKHRYPIPVVQDGGVRRSRDLGADIDTSWARKLVDMPRLAFGVRVGAQVKWKC